MQSSAAALLNFSSRPGVLQEAAAAGGWTASLRQAAAGSGARRDSCSLQAAAGGTALLRGFDPSTSAPLVSSELNGAWCPPVLGSEPASIEQAVLGFHGIATKEVQQSTPARHLMLVNL